MAKRTGTVDARVRHRFEAPAGRLFDAWLDPGRVRAWMTGPSEALDGATPDVRRVEIDPRVGGRFTFSDMRAEGEAVHWGTYLAIDRPRRLVFTWFTTEEDERERTSVVTLTLESDGDGCVATVVHEMSDTWAEFVEPTKKGWRGMLVQIDTWLGARHADRRPGA